MKFFSLFAVVIAFTSVLSFQSCSDESAIETMDLSILASVKERQEFLDLDVDNLKKAPDLQEKIFAEVQERIDPYVVYKDKSFHLTIKNGNQINISERLFEKMVEIINQTNRVIKELDVVSDIKDNRMLRVVNSNNLKDNIRFKVAAVENPSTGGISDYFIRWYGVDIYVTNQQLWQLKMGSGGVALAGLLSPDPTVSKAAAIIGSLGCLYFEYMQITYPNGVIYQFNWILNHTVVSQ